MSEIVRHTFTRKGKRKFEKLFSSVPVDMPRRSSPAVRVALVAARNPVVRGRVSRLKGTISRGYTRRAGYYRRFEAGGELKFFDTVRANAAPATAGTIMNLSLNLIPQGVTESTRVGRKCTLRYMDMRGVIKLPTTTTVANTSDRIRVIMYVDKQTNGATAAVTDILETGAINSFYNLANQGRFKILCDKQVTTMAPCGAGNGTTNEYGEVNKVFILKKKLDLPVEFSSTTGAIGEIRSNNVGVLAISGSALATFAYTTRARFSDSG